MFRSTWLFGLSLLATSACMSSGGGGNGETQMTESSFVSPASSGTIPVNFADTAAPHTGMMSDGDGTGYAYGLGYIQDVGFAGYSGILPTSTVIDPPTGGTLTYDAHYIVSAIIGIHEENGGLIGISGVGGSENITLTADFMANTLTGETDQLTVNGILAGSGATGLSGTVTYLNTQGALNGLVGSDEVVGAFHGHRDDLVYAGGFIGTVDE